MPVVCTCLTRYSRCLMLLKGTKDKLAVDSKDWCVESVCTLSLCEERCYVRVNIGRDAYVLCIPLLHRCLSPSWRMPPSDWSGSVCVGSFCM